MLHDTLDMAQGADAHGNHSMAASGHDFSQGQALGQGEVSRLLAVIAGQIAEADKRHCEALDEMKTRLHQLGSDARIARPQVPHEFAPAFSRIEDALSQLAERMAEARAERTEVVANAPLVSPPELTQSPIALRSGAPATPTTAFNWASDFTRNRSDQLAADPFDIVDNGGSSKASEVWTASEAEALTRVYEDYAAHPEPVAAPLLVAEPVAPEAVIPEPVAPEAEVSPELPAPDLSTLESIAHQSLFAIPDQAALSPAPSHDREWLEDRFADLNERLQASLDNAPVHDMLAGLDQRLVQLEQHLGLSLQDVAKRSDVEGLKLVEAHIEEIARHLEETQSQLGRLDNIEAQLNEVVDHLAAQFESRSAAAGPMPVEDYQRMDGTAAQSVASQFAGSSTNQTFAGHDDQITNVRELLESYIGERRDGDEHNALMLDTMQQALIRVLDRIDAMEQAQLKTAFQPAQANYSKPAAAVDRQRDSDPALAGAAFTGADKRQPVAPIAIAPVIDTVVSHAASAAAVSHAASAAVTSYAAAAAVTSHAASAEVTSYAAAAALPADEPGAVPLAEIRLSAPTDARQGVDRLRQDFVADAQRAKLRASATKVELTAIAADRMPEMPAGRGRGPAAVTNGAGQSNNRFGSMSPKLVVAAITLMAILGANSLWKMRSPSPEPVAGAASMDMPASDETATGPAESGETPAKSLAATPGADAPATPSAAANSFVFEADPASETVPAPSKISNGEFADLPPGIRLRQSTVPVSPANLAILQQQQAMANLSGQLGQSAANTPSPASFMKEVPIAAIPAAITAAPVQPGAPVGEAPPTQNRASALDLPPVTVGPLSLRLAAAKGDASAEFEAASRLAEGKGTSQNFKEALRWYQRSAAQGFAQAQYRLGTLYERGLGIKADTGQARSWYQRAAEQGNVKAMHNLAVLSASRQTGTPDYASAAKWFRLAADRDLQDSQYNLGVLYESGLGVEKDAKQAMKWYSLAARAGDVESTRRRAMIKAQLTPQEQAEAASAVTGFEAVRVTDPLINDARAAGEDWKKRMSDEGQG